MFFDELIVKLKKERVPFSSNPKMLIDDIRQVRDFLEKDLVYLHNDDFKGHCLKCKDPIMGNVVQYQ